MTKENAKIFLVDDDEFILDVYSMKFKEAGYKIEVASTGEEALKKIKEGYVPDIILLDVAMPKMTGFEMLEIIRDENLIPDTKVIVFTNLGQKEDVEKGLELKVDDYVVKAYFTPNEIVKKVESIISKEKEN